MNTFRTSRLAGFAKSPTFATWSSFATKAASFVVLYPFVLRGYSKADILFWLAVSLPASMLAVVDAGMTPTAVRFFSYGLGSEKRAELEKDEDKLWRIESVIGTVRRVYRLLTLACFVLASCMAAWIASNQPLIPSYSVGWVITTIAVTIYFWSFQYQAWLQASDRISELKFRETKIQIAALGISTGLAVAQASIVSIVIVNCGTLALLAYLHRRSARRGVHANSWIENAVFDRRIAGELFTSSWKSGVGIAASYGLNQGLCAWYAATASASGGAQFLLTMRLLQVASQISQAPFYTKIPKMALSYAGGDLRNVVEVSRIGIKRSLWMFVILGLGLAFVLPALLPLIGSKAELMSPVWLATAVLAMGIERIGAMLVQTYTVSNIVHWHWLNSLVACFAVTVGFSLWSRAEALAIPVSWLTAMLLIYMPVGYALSQRLFGPNSTLKMASAGLPALIVLLLCSIAFFTFYM